MSRADRIVGSFEQAGIDLLLITHTTNLRYVTGFSGSNGMAVLGAEVRRFVTDFRYVERARQEVVSFDREQAPQDFVGALGDGWPPGELRLGFEDEHVSVKQHARLRQIIPDRIELVPAGGLVEAERAVKDPTELVAIRSAARIVDEVYGWIVERGLVGRTEREVALTAEHEMRLRGADGPSFPSIVASAEHGALPHAEPRDVPIAADTLVTIDMGARVDGYCSDCTRTFATGRLPEPLDRLHGLVLDAQQIALDAVRPGRTGREVDAIARDFIAAAGHGEHFGHGLGHGVGLDIHEAPRLARSGTDALRAGNVVTVEPGIYVAGLSGVRIEDLALVTEDGREVLSSFPKALITVH
ncbi:MAG: aminopeptidase P family protein [Solirubrobacterales bacterium]|nr:aminopeptidase P family protein [Solirubrobacterales bacterium]